MPTSAAAPARAKPAKLSRRRALEILNSMPRLVATSNTLIQPGSVVAVAYEVSEFNGTGSAVYVFPEQPFTVLREITYAEYKQSLPASMYTARNGQKHC